MIYSVAVSFQIIFRKFYSLLGVWCLLYVVYVVYDLLQGVWCMMCILLLFLYDVASLLFQINYILCILYLLIGVYAIYVCCQLFVVFCMLCMSKYFGVCYIPFIYFCLKSTSILYTNWCRLYDVVNGLPKGVWCMLHAVRNIQVSSVYCEDLLCDATCLTAFSSMLN